MNETTKFLEKIFNKLQVNGKELIEIATRRLLAMATMEIVIGILLITGSICLASFAKKKWAEWKKDDYKNEWKIWLTPIASIVCFIVGFCIILDGILGIVNVKFYAFRSFLP